MIMPHIESVAQMESSCSIKAVSCTYFRNQNQNQSNFKSMTFQMQSEQFCSPYHVYYAHFICNDKLLFYAINLATLLIESKTENSLTSVEKTQKHRRTRRYLKSAPIPMFEENNKEPQPNMDIGNFKLV